MSKPHLLLSGLKTAVAFIIYVLLLVPGTAYFMQGEQIGMGLALTGLAVLLLWDRSWLKTKINQSLRLGFALFVPGLAAMSQNGYEHAYLPFAVILTLSGALLLARAYDLQQEMITAQVNMKSQG